MNFDFLIRIIVCFLLSIVIGIERQYRHKLVGLRTNVLVSLGAFMFNWVTYASLGSDNTRIAAQVVSGVGFLGAGIIMKDGNNIKGLNTAATLWCVAAIGLLTSSGLLIESCVGTLMVLISNIILRFISITIMDKVKNNQREKCVLKITCDIDNEDYIREMIFKFVNKNSLNVINLNKVIKNNILELNIIVVTSRVKLLEMYFNKLMLETSIISISFEHKKNLEKEEIFDEEDIDE